MMKIVSIFYFKVADLYRDPSIGEKINIEVSKLILLYNMPVSKKVQQYNTILVEPSIMAAYPTQHFFRPGEDILIHSCFSLSRRATRRTPHEVNDY